MRRFSIGPFEFENYADILAFISTIIPVAAVWYCFPRGYYGPAFVAIGMLLIMTAPGIYRVITEGW